MIEDQEFLASVGQLALDSAQLEWMQVAMLRLLVTEDEKSDVELFGLARDRKKRQINRRLRDLNPPEELREAVPTWLQQSNQLLAQRDMILHSGGADESACKPGSVLDQPCDRSRGDHPSGNAVADILMRSTHRLGRAALKRLRSTGKPMPLDLAPGGVYQAAAVTCSAGGLLHRRFTLTGLANQPAVCFLWHCPAGHPGWALPTTLPCGARTFLKMPTR